MKWKTSDFDYDLPEELIAQTPLLDRTSSRMLVIHNTEKKYEDKHFYDIVDYLHAGDVLVRNNTRVIPARLFGTKEETGAHVELLLLRQLPDDIWECLVGNAKVVKLGAIVSFHDGRLRAECIEIGEKGLRKMRMIYNGIFNEILDELGNVPLPPYIKEELKVPKPTCNVTSTTVTPFSFNFEKISSVKCKPAVGAAAEPLTLAYTVW